MPNVDLHSIQSKLLTVSSVRVKQDLANLFADSEHVTASKLILSFEANQSRKLILLARVQQGPNERLHVVKLGSAEVVGDDAASWQAVTIGQNVAHRMFVSVRQAELPDSRRAQVYEDASQLFGPLEDDEEVCTLLEASPTAFPGPKPPVESLQRILRQSYAELGRWFYRQAEPDAAAALAFYRRKLRLTDGTPTANPIRLAGSVLDRWEHPSEAVPSLPELRGDAIWLLRGPLEPELTGPVNYLDPYEYLTWVLLHHPEQLPKTLIGPAHGDFHAQNLLLGISRGEAEYPVIIDYGDFRSNNVLAWDFAKMEQELKARLFDAVLKNSHSQSALFAGVQEPMHLKQLVDRPMHGATARGRRTYHLLLAYAFERLLDRVTDSDSNSDFDLKSESVISDLPESLASSLLLLATVRREARLHLGRRDNRHPEWHDEYHFALAVCGLATAKFDNYAYTEEMRCSALISAGVAVTRLKAMRNLLHRVRTSDATGLASLGTPSPSHVVPLHHSFRLWKHRSAANVGLAAAEKILDDARVQFPRAVPVFRELALVLATRGDIARAEATLEEIGTRHAPDSTQETLPKLLELCRTFNDHETLCRLGRVYRDRGDDSWNQCPDKSFDQLSLITAEQWYRGSFEFYDGAFEFSRHHYPGGNAACGALFLNNRERAKRIAEEVAVLCRTADLASLGVGAERFWLFSTELTMAVLLDRPAAAANFMRDALGSPAAPAPIGCVQSTYDQLCRLHRVLGDTSLRPALDILKTNYPDCDSLKPGPFGIHVL